MLETKIHELGALGQSIWLDFIRRSLIRSGDLQDYVEQGVSGVTSNPAIFDTAISDSNDYDEQIEELAEAGKAPRKIYEALVVEDARLTADVLFPVFGQSGGMDGFFSLEVDPHLAHDKAATVAEAERLIRAVDRRNVMIKVPATESGCAAIQELTAKGWNVNVTLMFSMRQYEQVANAFLSGLEKRLANGFTISHITSVVSFFVSRVDRMVDELLDHHPAPEAASLRGRIGIANAKLVYQRFKELLQTPRWTALTARGAHLQRPLYGSTGTKNPQYSDVLYVDNLIGADTVITVPRETLAAFLDHGRVHATLDQDLDEAHDQLHQLAALDIDLDQIASRLLNEGIETFASAYDSVATTITERSAELIAH